MARRRRSKNYRTLGETPEKVVPVAAASWDEAYEGVAQVTGGDTGSVADEGTSSETPADLGNSATGLQTTYGGLIEGLLTGRIRVNSPFTWQVSSFLLVVAYLITTGWILIQDNGAGKLSTQLQLDFFVQKMIFVTWLFGVPFVVSLVMMWFGNRRGSSSKR